MTELREPLPPPAPVPAGWEGILEPGETILWQGRPDGSISLKPRDLPEIGFGVLFTGFALFWMASAFAMGAPWFFIAFGTPFVLVGSGVMLRSTVLAAWRRRGTWYTLTSRRAIIATNRPFLGRSLQSHPITRSTVLDFDDEGDLASLSFATTTLRGSSGSQHIRKIGFERIPEGRKVLALMRQIQSEVP